jgi:hypothetical protein
MTTGARRLSGRPGRVHNLISVREHRQGSGWPLVAMTAIGILGVTAATMFVIKAGGAATTADPDSPPPTRTVVATIAPNTTAPNTAAPNTAHAAAEVPVRLESNGIATAAVDLRQIVYTIAGNQRPDDPVTVVYADQTGELHTDTNVTLPWTMTVTPDVPVNYVTANSHGSQLNCWITDASGATVASDTRFAVSATCNR